MRIHYLHFVALIESQETSNSSLVIIIIIIIVKVWHCTIIWSKGGWDQKLIFF